MIATNYSFGIERDEEKLKENDLDHRKWSNPLEIQCVIPIRLHPHVSDLHYQASQCTLNEDLLRLWAW